MFERANLHTYDNLTNRFSYLGDPVDLGFTRVDHVFVEKTIKKLLMVALKGLMKDEKEI